MDGTLQHVYFFLNSDNNNPANNPADDKRKDSAISTPTLESSAYKVPPFDAKERAVMSQRTATTRDASESSSSDHSSSNSRSSLTGLSATAKPFVPPPRMTTATDLFVVRAAPGKGLGTFATKSIKCGTRIICEAPLLRIASNDPHMVWEQYEKLTPQARQEYDQLHRFRRCELDLELEARLRLPGGGIKSVQDQQVATMERFCANTFMIRGGEHAIFLHCARLNHSCQPNVFQSYNPTLGMKTVHAMRDIQAGEELVVNYLGRECHYLIRTQRWEIFRSQWGFTCNCPTCSDRTGNYDARHSLLANLVYGLQAFEAGDTSSNPFIPSSFSDALDMARDVLSLCLEQNMFGMELVTAHRLISSFALKLQDFETAWEAACNEETVERNIMGTELDDLKERGAGSALWLAHVWKVMKKAGYTPEYLRKSKKKGGRKHKPRSEQQPQKEGSQKKENKGHKKVASVAKTA